jgi:ankyrin repeat protein
LQRNCFSLEEIGQFSYVKFSMGYYLKYDDLDGLQLLTTIPKYDFNCTTFISDYDLPMQSFEVDLRPLLAVSAFYCSIKCFKFLVINDAIVSKSVCRSSVEGGHLELVRICEQLHGIFTNCLHHAIRYLHPQIAEWIFTNFPPQDYSLMSCIKSMNVVGLWFLVERCRTIEEGKILRSAILSNSAREGLCSFCTTMIREGSNIEGLDPDGCTPLQLATLNNQFEVCKVLLTHGSQVNNDGKNHQPVLNIAVRHGNKDLCSLFLKFGALKNQRDLNRQTPLLISTFNDNEEITKLLIQHGANLNDPYPSGETALLKSLSIGRYRMAKLLILSGADVNKHDHNTGRSPLDIAQFIGRQDLCTLLIAHGARLI